MHGPEARVTLSDHAIVRSRNCAVAVAVVERELTAIPTKIVLLMVIVADPTVVQFTPSVLEYPVKVLFTRVSRIHVFVPGRVLKLPDTEEVVPPVELREPSLNWPPEAPR